MSRSISDLVHQINTPIANIKMYSEFLKEEGLTPEEYVHFADNLEKQAQKPGGWEKDFPEFPRIGAGTSSLNRKCSCFAAAFAGDRSDFFEGRKTWE